MILPQPFKSRMKAMLGDEYRAFADSLDREFKRALRVNTLKADIALIKSKLDCIGDKTPFCPQSYYLAHGAPTLGNHPLHHAGAFYLQEPSASSAAEVLGAVPGDKVLDLCAAPGGKSTQIGAALQGAGLLWSNEIVRSRASALCSNIERMGIRNCVVSSAHPDVLCSRLSGYFDRVLVDAPCSGEGMFGKNPDAAAQWSEEHVKSCAVRQLSILKSAAKALRAGGTLVYSTCTFSPEENEGVIEAFLEDNKDFELADCGMSFGRPALGKARRILPMDGGEGHFVAKLIKTDGESCYTDSFCEENRNKTVLNEAQKMFCRLFKNDLYGRLYERNGLVSILPNDLPDLRGTGAIRVGVPFCEVKKGRLEPLHAVFMCSKREENSQLEDIDCDDEKIIRYLHGEEITSSCGSGFTAVAVNGIVTGFGKCSGGVLKNRYPKGLRLL